VKILIVKVKTTTCPKIVLGHTTPTITTILLITLYT